MVPLIRNSEWISQARSTSAAAFLDMDDVRARPRPRCSPAIRFFRNDGLVCRGTGSGEVLRRGGPYLAFTEELDNGRTRRNTDAAGQARVDTLVRS